jgi:cAMP-binding proteins - catabolite gene activator and regulatory subunit of cAMP-dependent protein kinases
MSINLKTPEVEGHFVFNTLSQNELIRDLLSSDKGKDYLLHEVQIVSVGPNQVLYEQGDQIDFVYFPLNAVVSTLGIIEDGTTVETLMIGPEGLVGMSAILGSGRSKQWVWVSISGDVAKVDRRILEHLLVRDEAALKALLKYYRAIVTQVSQRCICNTRHTIVERLCCWLLMVHDRVGGSNLRLTQEAIASRVGARRAGITVAAGALQSMGAIGYRRGHLHIVQRSLLEEMVCECYSVIKWGGGRFRPI